MGSTPITASNVVLHTDPIVMSLMLSEMPNLLDDLRIEMVKLQFQLAVPTKAEDRQKNDILGDIYNLGALSNGQVQQLLDTIRFEFKKVEQVKTLDEMHALYRAWDQRRLEIQYGDYFLENAVAIALVFMMRVVRKYPRLKPRRKK